MTEPLTITPSDDLHQRVQAFILASDADPDGFERLALDIAEFQARTIPAYGRLVRAHSAKLDSLSSIPAVPVEAFRMSRVAVHPPALDQVRFLTSGTTSGARGEHCMRRTDSYRLAALTWGRRALVPEGSGGVTVLCLAPRPESPQSSSLGFMMQAFLDEFDPSASECSARRWFLSEAGLDLQAFLAAFDWASRQPRPPLILATSFALVHLLDTLGGASLPTDGRTVVMQTGGFKGKSREVAPEQLRQDIAKAFGIDERRIVGEYGMTELSSQLYEATLPGASLAKVDSAAFAPATVVNAAGWYIPPPWLRVDAVDATTHLAVPDGEPGIASFLDLANVDSAVRILTQDRIVRRGRAVQLLGRAAAAPSRGCSLADEELLAPT